MKQEKKSVMIDKDIGDILDSDDEIPDCHYEIPDVPAYEDDNRFEPITFQWLDNFNQLTNKVNQLPKVSITETINASKLKKRKKTLDEKEPTRKGFLKKQDFYCLKSTETMLSQSTFLWLIDFFIMKDLLQSSCKSSSCLVETNPFCDFTQCHQPQITTKTVPSKKYYYELALRHTF